MAIHSTVFLSEPEQLPIEFPGWKPPLSEPVIRRSVNPFTREEITITSRAPGWDDFDPGEIELSEYQVVPVSGDYGTYLEQRLPPFVRSTPHCCTKNLTSIEIEPLVAAAGVTKESKLTSALYAHPSLGAAIEQFSGIFVDRLRNADDLTLRSVAKSWAERMSTPDHTHSASGERLQDDWSVDDALGLVEPIAKLARQCGDRQSMYLLTEA